MFAWALAAVGTYYTLISPEASRVRQAAMTPGGVSYSTPALEALNTFVVPLLGSRFESGEFVDNLFFAWFLVGVRATRLRPTPLHDTLCQPSHPAPGVNNGRVSSPPRLP